MNTIKLIREMYTKFVKNDLLNDFYSKKLTNNYADLLLSIDFEREINFLIPLFEQNQSKIVFSHNDLNRTNILIKSDRHELDHLRKTFIVDYEYSSYNYRWSDFAVIFGEVCMSNYREGKKFKVNHYPDYEKRIYFITHYVARLNRLLQSNNCEQEQLPEEETIALIEKEISFGIMIVSLINIFWRLSHNQIACASMQKCLWVS